MKDVTQMQASFFERCFTSFFERSFAKELITEGVFCKILLASYEVSRYLVSIYSSENVVAIGVEEF